METLTLFVRTLLVYAVVFLAMRLMGKREIGKLSLMDLVISIMIAEIAVLIIEDLSKPVVHGLIPIFTLTAIQIGIAAVALRHQKMREWFDGKPSYLIRGGRLDREEMRRQRYNLDDLMGQLRQNGVMNVADVEFAILETSGRLTVVKKERDQSRAVDPHDTVRFEGLPLPLIMDGKVQDQNLEKLGKTRFWLKNEIQRKGMADFRDIFFCSIDYRGKLFIDKKSK